MGCLHSKKEPSELHPNVFRVVNIDENGDDLCSGQLEITESDIILYRVGRDSTVWPLHSLRRYGFEGDLFSFESGRRCETGEGIYAFKCRRASLLFRKLQQQIQLRNIVHDSVAYPGSRLTPPPQGRQTLQATVIHRSSIDNGQPEAQSAIIHNLSNITSNSDVLRHVNLNTTPRSPSNADILEVTPLYPRPQSSSSHVTNVYQFSEFKREHNNNQNETAVDSRHVYCNDLNRDLAVLRSTLKQTSALNTMKEIEDETLFLENRYMNNNQKEKHLSPTLSVSSEHYAQLSLERQEAGRLYMNIAPNEANIEGNKNELINAIHKQVEYCNLAMSGKPELNTYANLALGDLGDIVKNIKLTFSTDRKQKFSESDTITSISPVEELEVNYAILDIESNKNNARTTKDNLITSENNSNTSSKNESIFSGSSQPHGRLMSQCSVEKNIPTNVPPAAIGYTTIDFDKTVALTSVAACTDVIDIDGNRKTRHNSINLICGSPSMDKNK